MVEQSIVAQTQLTRVLLLDEQAVKDPESVPALIVASENLWQRTDEGDNFHFVSKAAQIYSFAEVEVRTAAGLRKKWQVMTKRRESGEIAFFGNWEEFCLGYLLMARTTAVSYKRIWEVFVKALHYDLAALLVAGKSKLAAAASTVAEMLPGQNVVLMEALFGVPNKCSYCKQLVAELPVRECPRCMREWKAVAPKTLSEVLLLLEQIRKLREDISRDDDEGIKARFRGDVNYDEELERVVWVGWFCQGTTEYPLSPYYVDVIDDDVEGLGIPRNAVGLFMEELQKRMSK